MLLPRCPTRPPTIDRARREPYARIQVSDFSTPRSSPLEIQQRTKRVPPKRYTATSVALARRSREASEYPPPRESEGGDGGGVGSGGAERGMRSWLSRWGGAERGTASGADWRDPWVTRRPAHRVAVALTVSLDLAEASHHPFLPLVRCPSPLAAPLCSARHLALPHGSASLLTPCGRPHLVVVGSLSTRTLWTAIPTGARLTFYYRYMGVRMKFSYRKLRVSAFYPLRRENFRRTSIRLDPA